MIITPNIVETKPSIVVNTYAGAQITCILTSSYNAGNLDYLSFPSSIFYHPVVTQLAARES